MSTEAPFQQRQAFSQHQGWTCILNEGTLARGEGHDVILLEIRFRMQSAPSSLWSKVCFYPQENQWVRLKNSKPCRMSVKERKKSPSLNPFPKMGKKPLWGKLHF